MNHRKWMISIEQGTHWPGYQVFYPELYNVVQRDYFNGEEDGVLVYASKESHEDALLAATDHFFYLLNRAGMATNQPHHLETVGWEGEDLGLAISQDIRIFSIKRDLIENERRV